MYAIGRHTKEQLLKRTSAWGLSNRRGRHLTSQAIGMCAIASTPEASTCPIAAFGAQRGDFEPLISEDWFYRVQAVLAGRGNQVTDPAQLQESGAQQAR